jgi:hypothetical protein
MYLASVKKMNYTIIVHNWGEVPVVFFFPDIFSLCQKVFEALVAHRDSKIEILLALKKFYKTKKMLDTGWWSRIDLTPLGRHLQENFGKLNLKSC